MIDTTTFWTLTILLGVGTFLIRFSFLGLLGGRELPDRALIYLRYVGAAVLPAMFMPLLVWPEATGGSPDTIRLLSALAALAAGLRFGVIWAILMGMGTLYFLQFLFS